MTRTTNALGFLARRAAVPGHVRRALRRIRQHGTGAAVLELRPVGALVGVTLPPLRSKLSNHRRGLSSCGVA